jgi:hypothetical protein
MSATNWYISTDENGAESLCIMDDEGDLYSGTVKIFYVHGSDTDTTTDANQPNIPTRHHMALVFGALWLMGFTQYKALFDDYVQRAQKQVHRTGPDVIWPPFY